MRPNRRLSIFLVLAATLSIAEAAPAKTIYETYSGPCEDFNYHVKNRGLKDPEGNTHVSTLGYTSCKIQVSLEQSGIPAPQPTKSENKNCLATDISKAKFEMEQVVTVMRWDYGSRPVSEGCKTELQRTEDGIRAHEAVHVADCNALREETAKDWSKTPHVIKICAESAQPLDALYTSLKLKINEELQGIIAKMSKEMEYRSKETHERIGYGTSGINCSKCN